MEEITYFWKKKKKSNRKPKVCVCTHAYAHTHLKHAYAYLRYADASRVSKIMKGKLFGHKFM